MSEISNPKDLFLHELGDILYVERKLAEKVLPKLIDEVTDEEFRSGLENHLAQTRKHVLNVEKVFEIFGEEPHAEPCVGFEGLKKEHDQLIEKSSSSLIDHRPGCSRAHGELRDRGLRRSPSDGEGFRRGRSGGASGYEPEAGEGSTSGGREDRDPAEQRVDVRIGDEIGQRLSDLVPHESELARSLGVHCRVRHPPPSR